MKYRPGITRLAIIGQNDEVIAVHGEDRGLRGVYLSEDGADMLLTASPEKQTWKTGARMRGSRPKNRKILARDMDLTFLVMDTDVHSYEQNESLLLQAIGWELDPYDADAKYARAECVTDMSGTRYLDIVQYAEPDFDPEHDPLEQQFGEITLKCRAGEPDWYESGDDNAGNAVTYLEFAADGQGEITVENPTPRDVWPTWIFTRGTWTFPDFSWVGSKGARHPGGTDSSRMISTPEITSVQGGVRITRSRQHGLMVEDFNDTNILGLFTSYVTHRIPAYTQRQTLPIYLDDCPTGGARAELRMERRWPRPWGGELRA